MAVNLQKGQKVNLIKSNGNKLTKLMVGLGWDAAEDEGGGFLKKLFSSKQEIDCDASVFVCKNGKLADKSDIVYFNNLKHKSGAVQHSGDNLTGDGAGDDEQIFIDLNKLPAEYDKLIFVVNIYEATKRNQHFGMIKNAFIRIVDSETGEELIHYNLTDNYDNMLAMVAGEVYRRGDEWKFNAVGNGTTDAGLGELSKRFM